MTGENVPVPAGSDEAERRRAGDSAVGVLTELESVLRARAIEAPPGSYSATLLDDPQRASRKIMEEAFEVCWELGRDRVDRRRVVSEAADLMFHVIAALVGADVALEDVWWELAARRGPTGQTASADGGNEDTS